MTVKPYVGLKNVGLFGIWVVFMSILTGDIMMSAGIGLMMAVMFTGYPFTVGEKSNLDAFYTTLSIDKKTVVRGRYLFVLALDVCAVAGSFGIGLLGGVIASLLGKEYGIGSDIWAFLALGAVFVFIQAIQLPMYFKLGYAKAKMLSIVPFLLIGALYGAIAALGNGSGFASSMLDFSTKIAENKAMAIAAVAAAITVAVFVSYNLSVRFYKQREF